MMDDDPPRAARRGELDAVMEAIAACRICVDRPQGRPLPHQPRPVAWPSASARILVAGQAPGMRVHVSGKPFDDRSGDRLRDWMGIDRTVFYDRSQLAIVPMGFCFPGYDAKGGDLPPRRECRAAWHDRMMAAMPQIDLILAIGASAQAYHLDRLGLRHLCAGSLTATVANWRTILAARDRPAVIVLPHPSWRNTGWLKRHRWFEAELLPVLRSEVAARLGPR
ncbi:uracil-DNA glycosylase family protein [Phreatobacter sp. AB_2022a]|uniref:uracil-DNA glycosylase family protein n=1 Tax=Phreatobacter sp. AB_2022a TaxID=3003134 RepID=UPI0022870A43|nr:uracil-DNA glycosylase family protein [Phreatobacter sp. AB_2022a]MCZ0738664.1 uracil-DNA glycosylase family protein [Phreatobacter sp. AB_2022a]